MNNSKIQLKNIITDLKKREDDHSSFYQLFGNLANNIDKNICCIEDSVNFDTKKAWMEIEHKSNNLTLCELLCRQIEGACANLTKILDDYIENVDIEQKNGIELHDCIVEVNDITSKSKWYNPFSWTKTETIKRKTLVSVEISYSFIESSEIIVLYKRWHSLIYEGIEQNIIPALQPFLGDVPVKIKAEHVSSVSNLSNNLLRQAISLHLRLQDPSEWQKTLELYLIVKNENIPLILTLIKQQMRNDTKHISNISNHFTNLVEKQLIT
jgi:hypothetical protein